MYKKMFLRTMVTVFILAVLCILPLQSTQASGVWSPLGAGLDGNVNAQVNAMVADGNGNLYVGGYFTTAGGVSANSVAKWNGTSWSALGSGVDNEVYALALDKSGNLYAAGTFEHAGGNTVDYIAKWNGSSWSAMGPGFNGYVNALAFDANGNLYAGGNFSDLSNGNSNPPYESVAIWNGSSWSPVGVTPEAFKYGGVYALAMDGNTLYAGGSIDNGNGGEYPVYKWNGSSWSALAGWMNDSIYALAMDKNHNLYEGGYFTSAGGITVNRVAKWNGSAWSALGSGTSNGTTEALAVDGSGNLYAGGDFDEAGGTTVNYIAKWNGSSWSALGSGMAGTVWSIAVDGSNLYAGGQFDYAGGTPVNKIAKAFLFPIVSLNPSSMSFGNQLIGSLSASKTVTLTNNGAANLSIGTLTITAPYRLTTNTCSGATLIPAGTCTLHVAFAPTRIGATSGAQITIPSNASTSPNHIGLSGAGVAGSQLLLDPSFETDANNDKKPDSWTFTNFNASTDKRDCTVKYSSSCSLKLAGNNVQKSAYQTITRSGRAGDDYTFSLWSDASSVPSGAIYKLLVQFFNGMTMLTTNTMNFTTGSHGFQKVSGTFTAPSAYTKITFTIVFKASSGSAWFDAAALNYAP